jgi:hypothetical protein
VTSTDVELRLRPPLWARIWCVVFPVLVVGFTFLGQRPRGSAVALGAAFCACAVLLGWRFLQQAVIGRAGGGLLVRNLWGSRSLLRDDVTDVTVARMQSAPGSSWGVLLHLRDGSPLRLDVTQVPLFRGPLRTRLERQAAEVREWVTDPAQPPR